MLFRGINVGGKNILPMKELVSVLEACGCINAKTYIQSGNVVFQAEQKSLGSVIAAVRSGILELKGFAPTLLTLESSIYEGIIGRVPFEVSDGKTLHCCFLETEPANPDMARIDALRDGSEKYALIRDAFYLLAPDGIGRSKLAANVERCLGTAATARNWNTVSRLQAMAQAAMN